MRGGHAALTAALLIATACAPPPAGTGDPDATPGDAAAAMPRPDHGVLYYGSYGHDDDALVVGQPWLAGAHPGLLERAPSRPRLVPMGRARSPDRRVGQRRHAAVR
jgi:hypothetical protein